MLNTRVLDSAKKLRKTMTKSEKVLWESLRNKRLGLKFKRQMPFVFGDYYFIADFCCSGKKLIVEIDGEIHNDPEIKEYDKFRTKSFEIAGYKVIRFKNEEVLNSLKKVLIKIKNIIN